ncbi:MAG: LAGLIDADG family homing endonuclease [Candidatus Geothermarchaeales archaeon]
MVFFVPPNNKIAGKPVLLEKICKMTLGGFTQNEIATELSVDRKAISYWQNKLGLPHYTGRHRLKIKPTVTQSPEFWWLIGFLQGDGSVCRINGTFRFNAYSTDERLVSRTYELFLDLFGLDGRVDKIRGIGKRKDYWRFTVDSRDLYRCLSDFGLRFGGLDWRPPPLEGELLASYVAGIFDAEGTVGFSQSRLLGRRMNSIRISSHNLHALRRLKENMRRSLKIKCAVYSYERFRYGRTVHEGSLCIFGRENFSRFMEVVKPHCISARSKRLRADLLPLCKNELRRLNLENLRRAAKRNLKITPDRRRALLRLRSRGWQYREIASLLGVSERTVSRHVNNEIKFYASGRVS